MFTKQFITGLAAMALANQVTALNMYRAEDKRGVRVVHTHIEVVTQWVTVTAGQEPAAPTTSSETFVAPAPEPTPEPVAQPESTPEPEVQEEPAPVEPAPVEPAPVEPAPVEPAPVEAAPAPAATTPAAPTTSSETFVAPAPEPTPEPVAQPESTPEPEVQEEPAPVEPAPVEPAPVEPAPVEPAPVEAAPAPAATTPAAAAPVVEEEPVKQVETDNSNTSTGGSTSGGSTTTSGAKRGLAFNKAELTTAFTSSDKISWAWNWDSSANGLDSNVEYVPTLWGPIDMHTARWNENAEAAIAKGSTHLMSFNECDIASQCNLPASAAADAHVQYMNPFGDKAKIGAPSISNSNIAGQGLDYLRDWVAACETKGCKYDFCNVHWYSPLNAAETLYSHIKEASKICGGKPVWLTEFAPLADGGAEASPSESSSWLSGGVLSELDNLAELERYSFFMVADGKLTSGSGLSASGQAYLS